MKRRTAGRSAKPRLCAFCGHMIAEGRPAFLVAHKSGRLTGEYHAGCAEKLVLAGRAHSAAVQEVLGEEYGRILSAREETLPW